MQRAFVFFFIRPPLLWSGTHDEVLASVGLYSLMVFLEITTPFIVTAAT